MKLLEIIDTKIDYSSDPKFTVKSSKVGSGNYSDVFDSDEWSVSKMMVNGDYIENPKDPYTFYINYLIENKISTSNPFFPRVYNVHKKITPEHPHLSQYSFQIERLVHLKDLSTESLKSLENITGIKNKSSNKNYIIDNIVHLIGLTFFGIYNDNLSDNENLVEAVSILKDVKKEYYKKSKNNCYFDLHKNNFMARIGNTGPQLVFTDPFLGNEEL